MKEQNAERLSEYEKAQIEFAKGKAEFLQGCGGCLMIPIIIIILLCIVILIGLKSATTRLYDTEAKIICIVSKKGAQCIECHHKDI